MSKVFKSLLEKYPHEDSSYIAHLYAIHRKNLKGRIPRFMIKSVAIAKTEEDLINFS